VAEEEADRSGRWKDEKWRWDKIIFQLSLTLVFFIG